MMTHETEIDPQTAVADAAPVAGPDHALQLRVLEAILFAAAEPLDEATIALHFTRGPAGEGADVPALLEELGQTLTGRGFRLAEVGGKWALRSAPELADYLKTETTKPVKLSRAMSEVLAIVAYHQPVTRAEIEAIRGVATSKGTLDFLMEVGWVRPGHRRDTPGRPLTWITTPAFLDHFGLAGTDDLPGMEELKAAGLLDNRSATYGVLTAGTDAMLPPAIDGEGTEIDPDFLPSEETLAEQARPVSGENGSEAKDGTEAVEDIVDENDDGLSDDDFEDDEDDFEDDEDDVAAADAESPAPASDPGPDGEPAQQRENEVA